MLPYNFFISAIAAGLAMVSFEYVVASVIFKHECRMDILKGLAKGTAIALALYFALRMGDIMIKGNMALMFAQGAAGKLFMVEMFALVLLPMIVLFKASTSAQDTTSIMVPQILVLIGVVLNRLDILFLVQVKEGATYHPSLIEWVVTAGLIATIVFAYRLAAVKLPIASQAEAE